MNFFGIKLMSAYKTNATPNPWDLLALCLVLAIFGIFALNAEQMTKPYQIGQIIPISLAPAMLPFYASRTVMRMLIALVFSFLFTFIVGTLAAKNRQAEKMIVPLIDVLQSVPILGFLSITVTGFIQLFPGSLLGPECAAIFVIFTSQAWNMTFSFYQTVRTVPYELREAARMLHLSGWQVFWRIDVPYSMPGLLWNTMMSMSGGWFFVVASEAISVSNQSILLPGIGSYIATAIKAADMHAIFYAVAAMFIVIIIYDQLMFRPLVAWADKFKAENSTNDKVPESWLIDIFQRARLMRAIGRQLDKVADAIVNVKFLRTNFSANYHVRYSNINHEYWINLAWTTLYVVTGVLSLTFTIHYINHHFSWGDIQHVFLLGLITSLRVFILIIISTLIWVPIGIKIGLRPNISRFGQPIAQVLAAFPANLLYPFFVIFIITYHLNPNIWLTPLMILGAQWYILFNVIAGASSIPKDLIEVTDNFTVPNWLRWKRLILPAVFPYYVTGAITAAGGAWNASIVSEVASWGQQKVTATGLGAYITEYTNLGDFSHIVLGIGMMCLLILIFNRLLWRPLYVYAMTNFSLNA